VVERCQSGDHVEVVGGKAGGQEVRSLDPDVGLVGAPLAGRIDLLRVHVHGEDMGAALSEKHREAAVA
jgi:hypothetical protein